ncbi:MAG TPA: UDP-N-acetylmuramoyl-tripeptide--D-alanyl-D-alanine ligase [Rubrobacteraceae bacterium]|nr:UDP-N-acetylmuramoyl-tripeptide--D-alanyl-D-alanine ligase [Rubrobacteraceae bacterium]
MRAASLGQIAEVLGATFKGCDPETLAHGAATDSRIVRDGDLFFALRGATDGADFASEAHLRGAVATVADRALDVPTLVVEDALAALQQLARWSLRREDPPVVVGITGSVGKTTTKDALAAILRVAGRRVSATAGNFNNEIGLPLTILAANERTGILVLEMGATHRGDIEHLCSIAPPQVGVLTAIAPVHLDSFGSLEGVAEAKGELALALPESGSFVSPHGAPDAATGYRRNLARRIRFSRDHAEGVDLWISGLEERDEGLRFVVHLRDEEAEVRCPVFGTHLVEPLLAAIGGALALGLSLDECARGVSRVRRTGLRGEVFRLRDDIIVYDDSYNASPVATAAVLRYGEEGSREQGRRLVAVLGGMFELGAGARAYHHEIGELAEELRVDLLVCVGDEARWYAETFSGETLMFPDAESAAEGLREALRPRDYVVVKGSRGVRLDALTRKLRESLALV